VTTGSTSSGTASSKSTSTSGAKTSGAEIIAPREKLQIIWQNLCTAVHAQHGAPIGMQTLNALRLEAGIPWFPIDFNDTVIPHEAALEGTHISFTKGCYTGQEIVERVRSRGHVNRRRIQLKFSTQSAPPPGTKLRAPSTEPGKESAEVGYVTSSAFSPSAGTAIGMAYVRREHNSPGSIIEFEGGTATVIDR
jgi:folate-binding protein YgfZ